MDDNMNPNKITMSTIRLQSWLSVPGPPSTMTSRPAPPKTKMEVKIHRASSKNHKYKPRSEQKGQPHNKK
jgi:hypothetical protein